MPCGCVTLIERLIQGQKPQTWTSNYPSNIVCHWTLKSLLNYLLSDLIFNSLTLAVPYRSVVNYKEVIDKILAVVTLGCRFRNVLVSASEES